ncbi:hypothetical protein B9Z55_017594 [Caenorhabditis nigoni]|uniref:Uncharacterized protein n=1 Tax=Caenorhabditis nigoni TaxID=1611254 RepID=A0A2G5TAS8_9PELO|nr:hypothetical protein B9Z55_017594 [Caenorhabditis nigoni]
MNSLQRRRRVRPSCPHLSQLRHVAASLFSFTNSSDLGIRSKRGCSASTPVTNSSAVIMWRSSEKSVFFGRCVMNRSAAVRTLENAVYPIEVPSPLLVSTIALSKVIPCAR